jgi:hypothetical protein
MVVSFVEVVLRGDDGPRVRGHAFSALTKKSRRQKNEKAARRRPFF